MEGGGPGSDCIGHGQDRMDRIVLLFSFIKVIASIKLHY